MPAKPPPVGRFTELGSKKVYETNALSLSNDRRLLAAFCEYDVFLFDARKEAQLWCRRVRHGGMTMAFASGAISGDGTTVAAAWESGAGNANGVTVWRGKDWKEAIDIALPRAAQPLSVVVSPAGDWLAVSTQDNRIRVYSIPDGVVVAELREHKGWVRSLALTRDGRLMASADTDGGIRLWHTEKWKVAARFRKPADCVAFDDAGKHLVTCVRWPDDDDAPEGQVALVWDLAKAKVVRELRVPGYKFTCVAPSPDGSRVACGLENLDDILDQPAVLLDSKSKVIARLSASFEWFNDFAFLKPKGGDIAVAVRGFTRKPVILWEAARAKS
jgi:WD40 repeat protein